MLRTILKEVKEFKRASIATPIYMILEVLMEMLIPFLMASIIDQGVNAGDIHHIYKVGGLMIVAALLGLLAGMAGGTHLVDLNQNRIAITIQRQGLHILHMAGRVPLTPVFLTGARPERHATGRQRAPQRLVVHVADHQHFFGVELLDDGCHQSFIVPLETFCDSWVKNSAVVVCFVGHDGVIDLFLRLLITLFACFAVFGFHRTV